MPFLKKYFKKFSVDKNVFASKAGAKIMTFFQTKQALIKIILIFFAYTLTGNTLHVKLILTQPLHNLDSFIPA